MLSAPMLFTYTKQAGSSHILCQHHGSHPLRILCYVAQHIAVPQNQEMPVITAARACQTLDSTASGKASQLTAVFTGDGRGGGYAGDVP